MITGINESKTLAKHISCECKCKFDGRRCNAVQWCNNHKWWCDCEKRHLCEKEYIWNPSTCSCENGKYLASTMDDSAIMCDEIIDAEAKSNSNAKSNEEEAKPVPANFNEKNITCKIQNFTCLFINYHCIIDSC